MDPVVPIWAPFLQAGFAGFCGVLLGILVWLIRRLLGLLESTGQIIEKNTQAIINVDSRTLDVMKILRENQRLLISRLRLKDSSDATEGD